MMTAQQRVSIWRVALIGGVLLLLVASAVWLMRGKPNPASALGGGSTAPGQSGGKGTGTQFAGYVDVTATPYYPFQTPKSDAEKTVILSFIVADEKDGCLPTWGTYYTLDSASPAEALDLDSRIAALRAAGGEVRVSFGGLVNDELADSCSDAAALQQAYQDVIDRYGLTTIDFDVEGQALQDEAGLARRAVAAKALQDGARARDKQLDIWLTLPVAPTGLTEDGLAAVRTMADAGVVLAGVNGMTMDFGGSKDASQSMADAVMSAAQAMQAQVSGVLEGSPSAQGWASVGITPMIGQNDVPAEQFTIADARIINDFARQKGAGLLSMWSLNRDSTCVPVAALVEVQTSCSGIDQGGESFATILTAPASETPVSAPPTLATATVGDAPPATASASPATREAPVLGGVDDPATSPFPIWSPAEPYAAGSQVVWQRNVYRAKWWAHTHDVPGAAPTTANPSPWEFVRPVRSGETPSVAPAVPPGTYPEWDAGTVYRKGDRVQVGTLAYEAKWWTRGDDPATSRPWQPLAGASPAAVSTPGN